MKQCHRVIAFYATYIFITKTCEHGKYIVAVYREKDLVWH